jgi:hypothetical protein
MKSSTNITGYNSNGELISLEDIAGNVNKNLYNLGAFDTFKDNGNGTGTITRKTIYNDDGTQSEATTSYTETVILNQPIHTLNQDMELRVREEVEKGLNLVKSYSVANYLGNYWFSYLKPNTTYFFKTFGDVGPTINYSVKLYDSSGNLAQTIAADGSYSLFNGNGFKFTTGASISGTGYYLTTQYNNSITTVGKAMLTEGTTAYPYQPYYGDIMHTVDVPFYFSTNSTSPAETIGGTWTSLGSFTVGSNTVYAWKRV